MGVARASRCWLVHVCPFDQPNVPTAFVSVVPVRAAFVVSVWCRGFARQELIFFVDNTVKGFNDLKDGFPGRASEVKSGRRFFTNRHEASVLVLLLVLLLRLFMFTTFPGDGRRDSRLEEG